jgi:exopolysaccharide production protein ExoQ
MKWLAIAVCVPVIWWLWRRDIQVRPKFSPAFWLSLFYVLTAGARPLSWWLGLGGATNLEGNWFDRVVYGAIILAAISILSGREVSWGDLVRENKAIMAFYLFLLVTLLWAPFPFVGFRRLFRDFGAIFIILVILTEADPIEASKAIFARCAYIWFPLSEVANKYFPGIGRTYGKGGGVEYGGICGQKNTLGEVILIASFFLITELVQANRALPGGPLRRGRFARYFTGHHLTILITLAMGLFLIFRSSSRTSEICLVVGGMILLSHKLPVLRKSARRVVLLSLIAAPMFFIGDSLFGISDHLLALIGRNPTLTDRTAIWEGVMKKPVNPVIGVGYMMFWDYYGGVELEHQTANFKTAHNGYLDIYLDGGVLGLFFLAVMLLAVGTRAVREFLTKSAYGRLAFAVFVVMLLYNISESTYARRSVLWFAFLLFALEFRGCLPFTRPVEIETPEVPSVAERQPVGTVDG